MLPTRQNSLLDKSNKIYDFNSKEKAFREILKDFQNVIYRYCLTCTRNTADAEDLTQEVFLKLHENMANLKKDMPVFHWLIRTARNLNINHAQRKKIETKAKINKALEERESKNSFDMTELSQALEQLDEKEHELLILRYLEGYSCEALAYHFGTTANAISIRLYKIKLKLDAYLRAQQL